MHSEVFKHIEHFRFVQYEKGKLILAVVPGESFTIEEEHFLLTKLMEFFGDDFEVEIKRVEQLSKTNAGKFALVEQHLSLS